ncbi:MAG: RHS repeat-associated core domain-containing protein, partial [Planctomycetaceae bacterium]|nr:RHS repeat-associated core domain-containing protein [Planctomycetaceae bacterium]
KTEYLNDSRSITGYSQVLRQTEYDADGNIVKETSYIIGHQRISQTVKINGEETTLFFTFDGHGSTRVLLEAAGAIAQLFAFDAYGNAIGFNPAEAKTEFLYSGEQFDAKIGQQYLRARYYDPATGRFNRLDPFFGTMYDPQSFHKYLYTHDDPINSIDPTGKMSMVMSIGIGMAIGGVTGGAIGGIYATLRGLKGEHFWSTVRTGALIGAGGAFAYMAPIATLMAVTGSQSLSALALPILVAYNQLSSVPNKHLLGVILFFRWWGFASAPQINIPLQFFWKEYGNPNDESDASWLRHLNDVLFDDILTQPKYTEARNNIINEMTNKPVGTSMSNQNPIEINIYGDRGPLAWIIGGMELSYTATKTASGITIKWKLFDEVDAKSFMENYKDGQFNKNSSSEAWLIGTIEGLADILFDKLGQAWYPLSVYKTETIR